MTDADLALRVSDLLIALSATEVWRSVPGFVNYEISSWGNVRNQKTGRVLLPGYVRGYAVVSVCRDGTTKTIRIHHTMAEVFLGEPPFQGALAAHNDGVKTNNVVRNIRWASDVENQKDRVRHDTQLCGSRVFGAKLTESQIPTIRVRVNGGETCQSVADDYGVSESTIHLIKKGKIWRRAGGASWSLKIGEQI